VLTYVKDSGKSAALTLTVPKAALTALAQGNVDAARGSGLTTEGDANQLAALFGVRQPGDPKFNIVEP
jgi:alkyl sulfatase BDS1-like metallo-beta-lactamase superfamily hydrolase